jgi:hypothetical protein
MDNWVDNNHTHATLLYRIELFGKLSRIEMISRCSNEMIRFFWVRVRGKLECNFIG